MKDFWIRGKNIAIVGATTLVGRYLTYKLIEMYNCNVFAISENQIGLDNIAKNIGEYGANIEVHCFKMTVEKNWENFANYLTENKKTIDVLINTNVDLPKFNKFDNVEQKDIAQIMNANFYASVFSIRHLLRFLKNSRGAGIVNITYLLDEFGDVGSSAYLSSISAIQSYTEVIGEELNDIYVGLIKVGRSKTDIYANQNKEIIEGISKNIMSVDRLTDKIIASICKKRRRVNIGSYAHISDLLSKFLPDFKRNIINWRTKKKKINLIDTK